MNKAKARSQPVRDRQPRRRSRTGCERVAFFWVCSKVGRLTNALCAFPSTLTFRCITLMVRWSC